MLDAILSMLEIMGWLGIILAILVAINISCNTIKNVWSSKELFSWKKFFKGIGKAAIFYVGAVFLSIACTMLPFVNKMIADHFGTVLIANETLEMLSNVGVLGIVVTTVITQAKNALAGITALSKVSTNHEEITWEVEEE